MPYTKPYDFTPATDILSEEVNANFDEIFDALNTDVVLADATTAFTNVPTGPATDPSSDNHLSRKKYVDDRSPHTEVTNTAPSGNVTSTSYVNLPTTRCRIENFVKRKADTKLVVQVHGVSQNSSGLAVCTVAVDVDGTDSVVAATLGADHIQSGVKAITGVAAGTIANIEVQIKVSGGTQTITGRWSLSVTETY